MMPEDQHARLLVAANVLRTQSEKGRFMFHSRYPSLYQINTRIYLSELASELGRPATLDDIPDRKLAKWAETGFDFIWFLGIWQTGPAGRRISVSDPKMLAEYRRTLSDLLPSDVCGSCFAIQDYRVHDDFGGDDALLRLRKRLHERGLRLILDFVPNHTALDHVWINEHADYYVEGSSEKLTAEPQNYCRLKIGAEERILAHGRDPNFSGWSDTLQLNYGNPALQEAMAQVLQKIAAQCDGVRCDVAMLILPEVFEKTWGIPANSFWPQAIRHVRDKFPLFVFLAEVYWGLEWRLQQDGFDYTYDKEFYYRLLERKARPVREHLVANPNSQDKMARFLENHDEPRAAAAFAPQIHRPAAILAYLAPGLRFFHQGQFEGHKIHIPVQLQRRPSESPDHEIAEFYQKLLRCLKDPIFREGDWKLLECRPACEDNSTFDSFVVYEWTAKSGEKRLVAVNYSDSQSQCYAAIQWTDLKGKIWQLRDPWETAVYERNGDELAGKGLFLDMPAWAYHVFEVTASEKAV
jgi:hypothetical protein